MDHISAKRILLITHFFPPEHRAGTEQYTLGLGKSLHSMGHHVTVICAEGWNVGDEYWNGVSTEIYEGLNLNRVHLNWSKASDPNRVLYDSPTVEKWLDEFLANGDFDVVHVTSAHSLGVGILRSVKNAGIPLVLTLTDFWFLCPTIQLLQHDNELCDGITTPEQCISCLMRKSNLFWRLKKLSLPEDVNARIWGTLAHIPPVTHQRGFRGSMMDVDDRKAVMQKVFNLPDVIISPSRTVRDIHAKSFSKTVMVSNHGHDLSWLKNYSGKSKSEIIRFGYLGQIRRIKGVHLLVDAFVKAGLAGQARLDIWGNPETNSEYMNELNSIMGGNEYIHMLGSYERGQLATILSNIDVLVVPSIWYENAPLVIQEAFATKTPVIATNIGGMAEFVSHENNGLLFERNSSEDLAKQLRRIVDERDLLRRLSNFKTKVRTIEEEVVALDSIYAQLIEQKP